MLVIDQRSHVAGNCHTARDEETGVMVHVYGAHTFHTSNLKVWEYIQQFSQFYPFINRPKASIDSGIYSLPINLHTINQYFGERFCPSEAEAFIASKADHSIEVPQNLWNPVVQAFLQPSDKVQNGKTRKYPWYPRIVTLHFAVGINDRRIND